MFLRKHLDGEGGIRELVALSVPIVISQASVSLMLITDRFLLGSLGTLYPAAGMSGGLTSHVVCVFFMGVLSYITALSGQYLGAGNKEKCARCCTQGLWVGLLVYPLIVAIGPTFCEMYLTWAGIALEERVLSQKYFSSSMRAPSSFY